jgi:predicted Zn-dependent protease
MATAWGDKASALSELGRDREALRAVAYTLALDETEASIWRAKGNVLFRLKRYGEAASAHSAALDCDPARAWVWARKGDALCWLRHNSEAFAACEQAIARETEDAKFWKPRCTHSSGSGAFACSGRQRRACWNYGRRSKRKPTPTLLRRHTRKKKVVRDIDEVTSIYDRRK